MRKIFGRKTKKGSITVYLALALSVIVSLIFVCILSAGLAAGRAVAACTAEESMFSLFSDYDKDLYKEYSLLCLDAGFGGADLKLSALSEQLEENTGRILSPLSLSGNLRSADVLHLEMDEANVTEYLLLTDAGFQPFKEQICEMMEKKLGVDAIAKITEKLGATSDVIEKKEGETLPDLDTAIEEYKQYKDNAYIEKLDETEASITTAFETAVFQNQLPAAVEDPIEQIAAMRKMSIYSLILPDSTQISTAAADTDAFLHNRTLQQGMGVMPKQTESAGQKLLLTEFILDYFPDYTKEWKQDGLKYQSEYVIAGHDSDADNLRSVFNRIMLLREGFNYLYLMGNAQKKAEAEAVALILATLMASPEASEAIAQVLLLCWAYAESLEDLKTMINGGKEPLFKSDKSWQTGLLGFTKKKTEQEKDSVFWLSYRDYLRVFIYFRSESEVTESAADLLEYNYRIAHEKPAFSLDCCVVDLTTEFSAVIRGYEFIIPKHYGYGNVD